MTPRTAAAATAASTALPPFAQRVDGGLRREHVDRRGRAARSGRGRRPVQAGVREGTHLSGECGDPDDEQDGE